MKGMSLLASCYSTADGIGNLRQLHVRHTMRAAITHPPYERLVLAKKTPKAKWFDACASVQLML